MEDPCFFKKFKICLIIYVFYLFYNQQMSISCKVFYTLFQKFQQVPISDKPTPTHVICPFVRLPVPPYSFLGHRNPTSNHAYRVDANWHIQILFLFSNPLLVFYMDFFLLHPSIPTPYPSPPTPSITEDAAVIVSALYWHLNFFPKQSKLIYCLSWCINNQRCIIILYLVNNGFYLLTSLDVAILNQRVDLLCCFIFIFLFHIRQGLLCVMNYLSSRLSWFDTGKTPGTHKNCSLTLPTAGQRRENFNEGFMS